MESDESNSVSSNSVIEQVESENVGRRGRGRGRGAVGARRGSRGRGRPARRSRGRGRGHAEAVSSASLDTLTARRNIAKERVMAMDADEMRELMLIAADIYSSMVLDLLDRHESPGGGYHPPPTASSPSWCICGRCREMPERVCCEKRPENCISRMADFQVVILDDAVLRLARLYRQDVLAVGEGQDLCKENRHAAYRQFILWTHGRLGTGVRRPIPSCCVWAIRDRYPDPYGQYVGFVPSRLS